MSNSHLARRLRLLAPDAPAEHLNTAGDSCDSHHPSGVDQSLALGLRFFTPAVGACANVLSFGEAWT